MKETRILMGMPVTVEILDMHVTKKDINRVYDYFTYIDNTFSTYKDMSEITKINNHEIREHQYSTDMKMVFDLCSKTKLETQGYFDILQNGQYDPSGLVKGWAIYNAAKLIEKWGYENYYVDAGGDIQVHGKNADGRNWKIGIRNPFNRYENIKILAIYDKGVATSGTYIRGYHVYDPHTNQKITDIISLTVIGPNIYEADRFATAAFAMGSKGIEFIEKMDDFEGYLINTEGVATMTSGFAAYVCND